jgi:hypothetical protein
VRRCLSLYSSECFGKQDEYIGVIAVIGSVDGVAAAAPLVFIP